jgi:hypothetical protein
VWMHQRSDDVPRVVALIVAISQASYAFAPLVFGTIRELTTQAAHIESGAAPALFATATTIQGLAICAFLTGRGMPDPRNFVATAKGGSSSSPTGT